MESYSKDGNDSYVSDTYGFALWVRRIEGKNFLSAVWVRIVWKIKLLPYDVSPQQNEKNVFILMRPRSFMKKVREAWRCGSAEL